MNRLAVAILFAGSVSAGLFDTSYPVAVMTDSSLDTTPIRAKRQCGGMGGCCAGACGCGAMGQCGQVCCPAPPPPSCCGTPGCTTCSMPAPSCCGQPGCTTCTTNTVLVPVQQTTCCQCCRPVCTQACINGGGCGCGCQRGGCGRKRRSLLAIASEEMSKKGDNMV